MQTHRRHIVIDEDFDRTLVDVLQALGDEGLEIVARIDVREHFRRKLGRDFRRHLVFDVWSPELAMNAIREDLEAGTFIMTRLVIYELADGETVVAIIDGLASLLADPAHRSARPGLATLSDREHERACLVLSRLEHKRASVPRTSAA